MNAFGKFVLFSEVVEKEYIWSLVKSPVNTRELRNMLMNYTAGRPFSRRIYAATSKAKKPHHFIRVTNAMQCDLFERVSRRF